MAKTRHALARDLIWRLEAAGYDLFSFLIRRLPAEQASSLGGWLGRRLGPLTGAHRTALQNLRLAFPEMAETERERIAADQWENFGRYIFEFPIADRLTPASGRVEVEGFERLTAIARSGRRAVLISGHFSNIEIMAAVILAAGIDCDITYRAANNPYVDRRIKEGRFRYGVKLLAPKGAEGARDLLESLSAGRSIAMLNDQRYDGGVAGTFFGREVMTLPAGVRLALKFGCVLQPMAIQRTRGARFKVVIHEPIALDTAAERAEAIAAGAQAINAYIEARVRERPGEWWWMHRRWAGETYRKLGAYAALKA
jgi:KDO2-lipid IV(A) lauroyltransferase